MHRLLTLPFVRSRQLEQTVPFELESQIPFGLEEVLVDFHLTERTADGGTVLAVAVPRTTLTEHLDTLAAVGFDPTLVGLAPLAPLSLLQLAGRESQGVEALLDIGESRSSVVLLRDGVLKGLRTVSIGLRKTGGFEAFLRELRWTLLALGEHSPSFPGRFFLCGGGSLLPQLSETLAHAFAAEVVPFQHLALSVVPPELREEQGLFSACLGLGLSETLGLSAPAINLRRGEFAHQGQRAVLRREMGRLGWLAAGVVAAAGLAFALEVHRLSTRYGTVRQEIRRVFTDTLPEIHTIVSEKAQLQDAVTTIQSRQRVIASAATAPLELLRQLSTALPEQVKLDLDEWTFDEESIRLRGTTTSFDAAETIKTAATGLGMFREVQLKDVKTATGGKKVSFTMHLLFAPERG
jgi:general secretion pathway protein L